MRIGVHVGMTTVGSDVLSLLEANSHRLIDSGWSVAPERHDFLPPHEEPKDGLRLVEQTAVNWSSWLPTVETPGALMSCVHLGEALLVGGQASDVFSRLSQFGEVSAGALVRRIDDYVATRYLEELFSGRVRRLSERELAGAGPNNFLPRVFRWQRACGSGFRSVLCPSVGPDGEAVTELLRTLGVPDTVHLDLPEPQPLKSIGMVEAEVLRRLNRLLKHNQLDGTAAGQVRRSVINRLVDGPSQRPFALPADAANYLLDTFAEDQSTLAQSMTSDDAAVFTSREHLQDTSVSDSEVQARLELLAGEFELALDPEMTRSSHSQAFLNVKRLVRKARSSRLEGEQDEYLRCSRRVTRRLIPQLSEFRKSGAGDKATVAIPDLVLQYWDPAPPPEEMLPWMASWGSVGLPEGSHEVADYGRGLAAVEEAAGDFGRRAYESSTHPAVRSDLFRYAELYLRGGWYVDAEHEALVPIKDFLPWKVEHVLLIRPELQRYPNGFLGAASGSPLMIEALHQACQNILDGAMSSVMDISGPRMFTHLVHDYMSSPTASYVVLPANVVFGDVMQRVHNEAAYKAHGHWRHADI